MPRSSTTIGNPADAADKGRRRAITEAAQKAAKQAAYEAAGIPLPGGATPADPAAPPTTGATAETVAQHASASATAAAARAFPPACRIKLERLAPAWCRGYLETLDPEQLRGYGLEEYLKENWGGERYRVTVRESDDPGALVLWTAADVLIAGRPRHYGQEMAPPNPIPSAVLMPPAPPPAPAVDPNVRELTAAVATLARGQAAILEHLGHGGPAAAPAPPPPPTGSAPLLDAIRQAREVNEALDQLRPPPIEAPEREAPEGGMSEFSREAAKDLLHLGMEEIRDEMREKRKKQQPPAGGNGGNGKPPFTQATQVIPPPAKTGNGKKPPPASPPAARRL